MMKNAVKYPLQIVTAIFALTVFFFALSIPVCAEESSEPAEATQGEMDEAYDEAMMQSDSEVTFYTMEEANYQLAVICKFVSGKLTDEDYDEMNNPDAVHILSMDDFIALSDSFFKEAGIQTDLSQYEDAVSSWKAYTEGLSKDEETAAADELYEKLPLESRAEYLEAAYNVDNAVWNVLKNELGESLSGITGLVSGIGSYLEKGADTVSSVFTLIDKIKVFASVGDDNARFEKRMDLQKIKTRFTLLQQMFLVTYNVIRSVPSFPALSFNS